MVSFADDRSELFARIKQLEAQVTGLQGELERTTIALAESAVGVFDWNLATKTIYVSPILQQMLGHDGDGLPPDPSLWICYLHPDDRFKAEVALREALMYGRTTFHGVYRVLRKDGAQRTFLFRAVIMRRPRGEGGDAFRVLGTAADATSLCG
jgi:PAS domain-containing protein